MTLRDAARMRAAESKGQPVSRVAGSITRGGARRARHTTLDADLIVLFATSALSRPHIWRWSPVLCRSRSHPKVASMQVGADAGSSNDPGAVGAKPKNSSALYHGVFGAACERSPNICYQPPTRREFCGFDRGWFLRLDAPYRSGPWKVWLGRRTGERGVRWESEEALVPVAVYYQTWQGVLILMLSKSNGHRGARAHQTAGSFGVVAGMARLSCRSGCAGIRAACQSSRSGLAGWDEGV
jgi:hypothetical protein